MRRIIQIKCSPHCRDRFKRDQMFEPIPRLRSLLQPWTLYGTKVGLNSNNSRPSPHKKAK